MENSWHRILRKSGSAPGVARCRTAGGPTRLLVGAHFRCSGPRHQRISQHANCCVTTMVSEEQVQVLPFSPGISGNTEKTQAISAHFGLSETPLTEYPPINRLYIL